MATTDLSRSDRGMPAEVSADAKLDRDHAKNWISKREATLAENAQRRARRDECLFNSALTGGCVGAVSGCGTYRLTMRQSARVRAFMGGGGQAFGVFVGFFMPFMFVSNVVRWRCMKRGLQPFQPPRKEPPAS